jgi:hypothetical protein
VPNPGVPQPLETVVLWSVYDSLQQELTRISNLIEKKSLPSKDEKHADGAYERVSFLEDYLDKVSDHFTSRIRTARNDLSTIRKKIRAGQSADLAEAWNLCVKLRSETVTPLSSELLALIGGAFLQATRLDSVRETPDDEGQTTAEHGLSFSDLSRDLVKALAEHSQLGSKPVLIVGEEYLGAGEAELIRLRFPACDIWSLPLAAHEYGYLAATKESWAPPAFGALRKQVREQVRPTFYEECGSFPGEDGACFIEEIRREWELYQHQERDTRKSYCEERNARFAALEDQQEHYLCHLFADAFATFYVGPAYVHALLNLRFVPERLAPSSPYIPPFTHRFVFALQTLRWMQQSIVDEGLLDSKHEDFPFQTTLPKPSSTSAGLYELWQKALTSAGQPDTYKQTLHNYSSWYDKIKSYFVEQPEHLAKTYASWCSAVVLREHLLKDSMVIPATDFIAPVTPAKKWTVLNAAWSARWLYPDKIDTITANVQRLFDPQDTGWCESSSGVMAHTFTAGDSDPRQAAMGQIITVMVELGLAELAPKFATTAMSDDEKKRVCEALEQANKRTEATLFKMLMSSR